MHFFKAFTSFASSVSRGADALTSSLLDKILPARVAHDHSAAVPPRLLVRLSEVRKLRTRSFRKTRLELRVLRALVRAGRLRRADWTDDYIDQVAHPGPPPPPVTRVRLAAAFERNLLGNRQLRWPAPKTTVRGDGEKRPVGVLHSLPCLAPARRVRGRSQWAEDSLSAARRQMLQVLETKSCLKVAGEPSRPKKVRWITDEDEPPIQSEYVFKTWEVVPK